MVNRDDQANESRHVTDAVVLEEIRRREIRIVLVKRQRRVVTWHIGGCDIELIPEAQTLPTERGGTMEELIKQMLEQLAKDRALQAELLRTQATDLERVVPEEVKKLQEDIRAEYEPKLSQVAIACTAIEAEIRARTLEWGKSVAGGSLLAVFAQGRVSWDTKALDGFAAAHPEMARFRKIGGPTVTIRGKVASNGEAKG